MMISIAEAISDLLFVRDVVLVPGLGAFVKKPTSAMVNPVANYFTTPNCVVEFDASLREDNDLVVNYISKENDIPIEEAKRLLAMFVSDCFNSLKQGKKVVLNPIGTLSYDWESNLVFEQDKSMNYNADAFGLCDFTPEPVIRSKSKEEIKAEIQQQQKEKNTPVTVDEKAVHEHDENEDEDEENDDDRSFVWLWIVLGLLLVTGVVLGLQYFKIIDVKQWLSKPSERVINIKPGTYTLPTYTVDWDEELARYKEAWRPAELEEIDSEVADTPTEAPTMDTPEANIRIIAGCFGQEENAVRLTNTLKKKGYQNAFYELRNNKWFVSFGRYRTDEEATVALREIRTNTEYKAWILK